MMPQAQIRRMAVQSAAYELRVHAERDYVDMDTCQDELTELMTSCVRLHYGDSWLTMMISTQKMLLKF